MEIIQIGLLAVILAILLRERSGNASNTSKKYVILDSSTIIDGRITEIATTGFLPGRIMIPQFITRELQLLADGNDSHKRERARFGLDIVARLQEENPDTIIGGAEKGLKSKTTDDKLIELAKNKNSYLCTNDFNLNKVAVIEGVTVLNVNQLANAVRTTALPGEQHTIKIIQKGSNRDQGVGYLDDGTMVVVSGAGRYIGKNADIIVTRMLQTDAGKMMFAKMVSSGNTNKRRSPVKH